jgi:hypothetical protein
MWPCTDSKLFSLQQLPHAITSARNVQSTILGSFTWGIWVYWCFHYDLQPVVTDTEGWCTPSERSSTLYVITDAKSTKADFHPIYYKGPLP